MKIRYASASKVRKVTTPSGKTTQAGEIWCLGSDLKYYKLVHRGRTEIVTDDLHKLAAKIRKAGEINLQHWAFWRAMSEEELAAMYDAEIDNYNDAMGR